MEAISSRFGPVGEALADALTCFALPLVRIVAEYSIFAPAKAGERAELLFTVNPTDVFTTDFKHCCTAIAYTPDGHIWAAARHRVHVLSHDGEFLFEAAPHQLYGRIPGMAVDTKSREVFLTDDKRRVVVCALDGTIQRTFGQRGHRNEDFENPKGIAVDSGRGLVFVADQHQKCVKAFTRMGGFVWKYEDAMQLRKPTCLAMMPSGDLMVSAGAVLQVLTTEGRWKRKFIDFTNNLHSQPTNIAFDSDGNTIVSFLRCVRVLDKDGGILTTIFCELSDASGLCVDPIGRVWVGDGVPPANLSYLGDARIRVFGFGCGKTKATTADG